VSVNKCDFAGFLTTVFAPDDYVWVTDEVTTECYSIHSADALDWYNARASKGVYMAINSAIAGGLPRKKDNVLSRRTFLIEFDEMALSKQMPFVKQMGLPYTSCTFSAGKSLHFLLVLETPVGDADYATIFSRIAAQTEYTDSEGKIRYHMDIANKDICRFSRLPTAFRGTTEQKLIHIHSRIHNADLLAWLDAPKQAEKWRNSQLYKIIEKKNKSLDSGPTDRKPFLDMMQWYLDWHVGVKYNGDVFVQCPVCASEGGDKGMDNLHVTGNNMLTHCFAHPDMHNHRVYEEIAKLKQEVIEENQSVNLMEAVVS
jgi:hypothetical protein